MSTSGRTAAQRKPTDVRQSEIVETAVRILATQGSRRLTARLIAAEIGVTEGAIFRHFPSMEAIVDGVVARLEAILFDGFPPQAADPLARLGLFFQRRVQTILAHPHLSRMLLSDHLAQAGGPDRAARLDGFKRRSQGFVLDCLREAQGDGVLAPDLSPEAGAVLVLGGVLALAHADVRLGEGARMEQLAREVWSALERALRGGRPAQH